MNRVASVVLLYSLLKALGDILGSVTGYAVNLSLGNRIAEVWKDRPEAFYSPLRAYSHFILR